MELATAAALALLVLGVVVAYSVGRRSGYDEAFEDGRLFERRLWLKKDGGRSGFDTEF